MTEEPASPSQRAEARARREGAPDQRLRAAGGQFRPVRFRIFPPADRDGAENQQPHRPAHHRYRRRRPAARRARALRPRAGRAPDKGALACRLQARAGRHAGLRALSQDPRRARPLSRPRRRAGFRSARRRSTASCRRPRSPFPPARRPTRPRKLQILAPEMPEPHSPRPEAPRRARRQRTRWNALSFSRKADHGATVYILRCADGGYFTGVARRTAEDRPGEHRAELCSTTLIPSAGGQ